MDEFSWAPSTPPFPDEPMGMDDGFGMLPNDWQQNEWAPDQIFLPAPSLATQPFPFPGGDMPSCLAETRRFADSERSSQLFPEIKADITSCSARPSVSVGPNHLADDGLPATEFLDGIFDSSGQPMQAMTHKVKNDGRSSPHLLDSSGFRPSPPNSGPPTSVSSTDDRAQLDGSELPRLADLQYLATLPHSVLKELSKNVAEALVIAKKKAIQQPREQETASQLPEGRLPKNAATGPNHVFRCEQPGCKTTFRRNKDRLRHVRQKHTSDVKTFSCPVIDCPKGHGHKFHRSDKLRDHLRGERISSLEWCCVLPGCFDIVATRVGLIDHLGQHDFETRKSNKRLLVEYGFAVNKWRDYLYAKHICSIQGCPFGTDDEATMLGHLSNLHNGPSCPCPIPSCGGTFQDWLSLSRHLARAHDYATRCRFARELQAHRHDAYKVTVLCPICDHEIIDANIEKVRAHWQKHNHEQCLQASEAITEAVVFALGPNKLLYCDLLEKRYKGWPIRLNGDKLFPYLNLPDEELNKLDTNGDFERAGAELRAAIELRKKGKQS
ncbi:hypothetical protein BGZ57DRAFT_852223 [Hyaloscypha finlandica]|nr:hypothetical protein BGZ57DRAFT_852223 [Hyaloscypha finlandica]